MIGPPSHFKKVWLLFGAVTHIFCFVLFFFQHISKFCHGSPARLKPKSLFVDEILFDVSCAKNKPVQRERNSSRFNQLLLTGPAERVKMQMLRLPAQIQGEGRARCFSGSAASGPPCMESPTTKPLCAHKNKCNKATWGLFSTNNSVAWRSLQNPECVGCFHLFHPLRSHRSSSQCCCFHWESMMSYGPTSLIVIFC